MTARRRIRFHHTGDSRIVSSLEISPANILQILHTPYLLRDMTNCAARAAAPLVAVWSDPKRLARTAREMHQSLRPICPAQILSKI